MPTETDHMEGDDAMTSTVTDDIMTDSLAGQLLIAMPMPAMGDPRFERSVIYICAHSDEGAMGLVINKPAEHITFPELLEQLSIDQGPVTDRIRVHVGGPVDTSRGFVLHTTDYHAENSTLEVSQQIGLTATIDILRAMAAGGGPEHALLALGYAGWGPGQLEAEIKTNGWLNCPPDPGLIFARDVDGKWQDAMDRMGVNPASLSFMTGRA